MEEDTEIMLKTVNKENVSVYKAFMVSYKSAKSKEVKDNRYLIYLLQDKLGEDHVTYSVILKRGDSYVEYKNLIMN